MMYKELMQVVKLRSDVSSRTLSTKVSEIELILVDAKNLYI